MVFLAMIMLGMGRGGFRETQRCSNVSWRICDASSNAILVLFTARFLQLAPAKNLIGQTIIRLLARPCIRLGFGEDMPNTVHTHCKSIVRSSPEGVHCAQTPGTWQPLTALPRCVIHVRFPTSIEVANVPSQSYFITMAHLDSLSCQSHNVTKTSEVPRLAPETTATATSTTIASSSIWPTQCR